MLSRSWLKLAALLTAVALLVAVIYAWRADQRDRAQLAAELASTKQLLAAAGARQHDRDVQLSQTLAALTSQKRAVVTPAQIIKELPNTLPLPVPITLQPSSPAPVAQALRPEASSSATKSTAQNPQLQPAQAIIPAADLKPLYDFTLDCKACQAKLSAAQQDLADERQKTAALTKERDEALRIAKGGSPFRRIARAAKWFLLGAAAGAVISKAR